MRIGLDVGGTKIEGIALGSIELAGRLVSNDGHVAGLAISFEYVWDLESAHNPASEKPSHSSSL